MHHAIAVKMANGEEWTLSGNQRFLRTLEEISGFLRSLIWRTVAICRCLESRISCSRRPPVFDGLLGTRSARSTRLLMRICCRSMRQMNGLNFPQNQRLDRRLFPQAATLGAPGGGDTADALEWAAGVARHIAEEQIRRADGGERYADFGDRVDWFSRRYDAGLVLRGISSDEFWDDWGWLELNEIIIIHNQRQEER